MSNGTLLVLFGHENNMAGELSAVARSRCNAAIALFNTVPNATLLPTGAFGEHFNTGERMHAQYLPEHLVSKGVPRDKILQGQRAPIRSRTAYVRER